MTSSPTTPAEVQTVKSALAAETLRACGSLRLQVTGWSMFPAVCPGDTLFISRADADEIAEGEIVLFQRDRRLVAHRVTGRSEAGEILTRGDAMAHADPPVEPRDLLGKVTFLLRDGACIAPARRSHIGQRAVSRLMGRSDFAARLIAGVHARRQSLQDREIACRN